MLYWAEGGQSARIMKSDATTVHSSPQVLVSEVSLPKALALDAAGDILPIDTQNQLSLYNYAHVYIFRYYLAFCISGVNMSQIFFFLNIYLLFILEQYIWSSLFSV